MPMSKKQMKRIENKKMKMEALVNITKLNDIDRAAKLARVTINGVDCVDIKETTEPSAKRSRTEETSGDRKNNNDDATKNQDVTKTELLSYEELKEVKKRLRKEKIDMKTIPNFRLREVGDNASLSVDLNIRTPLFMNDIQHLLLYSQLGQNAPYSPQRWCQLEKFNRIQHTVVLVVDNVSIYNYVSNESLFPTLSANFKEKVEVISPASYRGDIIQDLGAVPLTNTQMKKFIHKYSSLEAASTKTDEVFDIIQGLFPVDKDTLGAALEKEKKILLPKTDKFPRTHLLLSGWQMIEENYPLPIVGLTDTKYKGYVLSKETYIEVTPKSPMYGIDCEMCKTTRGDLELTRVSIVDESMEVVYEQLVKPANRIIDYLTQFSGITQKMMVGVTKRLEDVQEDLRELLPPDAILVGQSLNNDLHALKLMHPYVIDTSIIFNLTGDRQRKTRLQVLSKEFLKENIQTGKKGHCSVEDSAASLKLAQKKLSQYLEYGDAVLNGVKDFDKRYVDVGSVNYATSMLRHISNVDKRVLVVSNDETIKKYGKYTGKKVGNNSNKYQINFLTEQSNKDVIKRACNLAIQHSLTIAHVKIIDNTLNDVDNQRKMCKLVDKWVKQIWTHTALHGLCVVIFGGQAKGANGCCFVQVKKQSNIL